MRILVIDTDWESRPYFEEFASWAASEGIDTVVTGDGGKALQVIRTHEVDAVLLNVEPGGEAYDGRKLFRKIKEHLNFLPVVIVVPGKDSTPSYFKLGADGTFFMANIDSEILISTLRSLALPEGSEGYLCGRSDAVRLLRNHVYSTARFGSEQPTLLIGPLGCGCVWAATAIHAIGPGSKAPFIRVRCLGNDPEAVWAGLIGSLEKSQGGRPPAVKHGHLTRHHGSTVYIEDIDTLPGWLQANLARVIASGDVVPAGADESQKIKIDARIIVSAIGTATHIPSIPENESGTGRFLLPELRFACSKVVIDIPGLDRRREDIPAIALAALEKHSSISPSVKGISERVMARLIRRSYPGNIPELENMISMALVLSRGDHGDGEELLECHFPHI